jgi:RND family efflux transporter MFP subunit
MMAPVKAIHVRVGDRVRRGATLFELDPRESLANRTRATALLATATEEVRAAETAERAAAATVILAQVTHERIKALHDRRSATPQEFDQAVATLASAEAQLASAHARVAAATASREAAKASVDAADVTASYATVTAPFDGVVTERFADPGGMAVPGVPLLTMEDTSSFRVDVLLDEARAGQLTIGDAVDVDLDGSRDPARRVQGCITEIGRPDPMAHTFLIKVALPSVDNLRSGSFGRVHLTAETRRVLALPVSAVVRRAQLTFVFLVGADTHARLQPISIGDPAGPYVEVLAGLHEGDRVVTNPTPPLTDGSVVSEGR